jgi:hypothetical protein
LEQWCYSITNSYLVGGFMLILILLLILGAGMAYISQFNLMLVSVNFGTHVFTDIPLFYVMIACLVTGLVLSYLVYFIDTLFTSWAIRGKDIELKKTKQEVLELAKRIHKLELENERLKHNSKDEEPVDPNAL